MTAAQEKQAALFKKMNGFRVKHHHVHKCVDEACEEALSCLAQVSIDLCDDTPPIIKELEEFYREVMKENEKARK